MPAFFTDLYSLPGLSHICYIKTQFAVYRQSLEIQMKNSIINIRTISALLFLGSIFISFQLMANNNTSDETNKFDVNVETAELLNTYWKLVEMDGEPVVTKPGQREMKLTLHVEENKVNGFGGCNSFFGTYTHDESKLKFGPLAATRMFCADEMDQESLFFKLLSAIESFTITGQVLHLNDDQGKPVLTLEAVYLK